MSPSSRDRKLIPMERELKDRLEWFTRLRWFAATGIFLAAWATSRFVAPELSPTPFYLVGLAVLAYNTVFHFTRSQTETRLRTLRRIVFYQIALDWAALTIVVHNSGGVRSPVTLAFVFHLIIAALLLSEKSCYILAGSASLLLGVLTILEETGLLPPPFIVQLYASKVDSGLSGLYLWTALLGFFLITTYLATSITTRLREREIALTDSEHALDRAYREMEALYHLGQIVNSTLDVKEVLSLIAENAARLMGMKACFIRLFDRTGKRLYIGGSYGLSQAYIDKGPVEVEKSLIDRETLAGGVVQVFDVGSDDRFQYREEARREGLASVLCVPVEAKNRVLGVIRIYSAKPHHFSKRKQQLLKNLSNLGAVAIQNARSYSELEALNEEKLWFARMTHHQLRAPLAAIRATLDALPYADKMSPKQQELADRARRRVDDAFDTIRDLLDLAAAQRPLDERPEEPVILGSALEKAVELALERASGKGVELEVSIPENDILVTLSAEDVDRIFSNLLDNSVKYTGEGGRVRLDVRSEDERVQIEVSDTGIGIEPKDQERIFEGFYRTASAKSTGEMGTGLGLSIVKKLVERWGGELQLESTPGKGTRFTITLPIAKAAAKEA